MIPVLFDPSTTYVWNCGKGKLAETLRCVVHEELNGDYSLELDYPISGKHYGKLLEGGKVGAICPNPAPSSFVATDAQLFDLYSQRVPIDGVVTFKGAHLSRRLSRSVVRRKNIGSPTEAKTYSTPNDYDGANFSGSSDMSGSIVLAQPKSVLASLIGDENSFVSDVGGEFAFSAGVVTSGAQSCSFWWLNKRGSDKNKSIRFGINMLDVEHTKDESGAYNAVVPYWDDGNGNITYVTGYIVQPTTPISPIIAVPLDLSNDFETQPTDAQMVELARQHLDTKTPWTGAETIKVDFINETGIGKYTADSIMIGDTVHVYWGDADIATDLRVVAYDYDVLAGRYISLELGTPQKQYVAVTGDYAGASGGGSGGGGGALAAYPVGSIYMSVNSTDPGTLFGGTWERITGRFLLAATDGGSSGASQAAGRTGGEATHTLTTNQIPAHTHGSESLTGYTRFRRYGTSGSGSDIAGIIGSSGIVSKTSETWPGTHGLVGTGGVNVSNSTVDRITVNATHEHNSVGGGQAHNNMPPYLAVYVWKRTA